MLCRHGDRPHDLPASRPTVRISGSTTTRRLLSIRRERHAARVSSGRSPVELRDRGYMRIVSLAPEVL